MRGPVDTDLRSLEMSTTPTPAPTALDWLREAWRDGHRRTFALIDSDGDGEISPHELARAMELHGRPTTPERAEVLLASARAGGERADFASYLRLVATQDVPGGFHDELALCFRLFDRNGDSRLDATELTELLEALGGSFGRDEVEELLEVCDTSGDGALSLPELFAALWEGVVAEVDGEA